METEKLKNDILKKYVHGAFNETNIEAFKKIFHPEFSIINVQESGSLFHFTRNMWEEVLQKRLADEGFDYSAVAMQAAFKSIEIAGDRANVALDLMRNGKVVYTDFLLLIRIDNEWKIVSKIYHEH